MIYLTFKYHILGFTVTGTTESMMRNSGGFDCYRHLILQ